MTPDPNHRDEVESAKVTPLRKRTMTLRDLQMRTLDALRKVRFQLGRQAHEDGMSDAEFIDQILDPLEQDIFADRHVLKMHKHKQD